MAAVAQRPQLQLSDRGARTVTHLIASGAATALLRLLLLIKQLGLVHDDRGRPQMTDDKTKTYAEQARALLRETPNQY